MVLASKGSWCCIDDVGNVVHMLYSSQFRKPSQSITNHTKVTWNASAAISLTSLVLCSDVHHYSKCAYIISLLTTTSHSRMVKQHVLRTGVIACRPNHSPPTTMIHQCKQGHFGSILYVILIYIYINIYIWPIFQIYIYILYIRILIYVIYKYTHIWV